MNLAAEELNPLIPHVAEIVLGIVVFLILVFLIGKFVVPNFEKAFSQRTAAIEGGMQEGRAGAGGGQGGAGDLYRAAGRGASRGRAHP
jgi:hypothetical protein